MTGNGGGNGGVSAEYLTAALVGEVTRVREAVEGTRNHMLNRAAFSLGQFVAQGLLDPETVADQLGQAALDCGLAPHEIKATIRSGLRGGRRHPRDLSAVGATDPLLTPLTPADAAAVTFAAGAPSSAEARWRAVDARLSAMLASAQPAAGSRFAACIMRRSELAGLPPVEPLIEGVMSRRSAVLLVGSTGIGKTFLSLSFACSVGTGTTWLGRPVERTKVLYVVGEGATGLHGRITAWELAWGVKVTDEDVVFAVRPDSLASPATWRELTAYAIQVGAGLVILDTLSSLAPEVDETKEAALMTRHLSDLAGAIDGTALLVHHPGWSDNTRSRGGYQLEANVDEVLVLTGVQDSDLLELKRKKVKEGDGGQRLWLRRRTYADSLVIEHASQHDIQEPLRDRIVTVLSEVGEVGITAPQLKDALGLTASQVPPLYRKLNEMVDAKEADVEGPKGRRRYFAPLKKQ